MSCLHGMVRSGGKGSLAMGDDSLFERRRDQLFESFLDRQRRAGVIDAAAGLVRFHGDGKPQQGHDIRQTAYVATALAHAGELDLAWRLLAGVLDHQDDQPDSMTRGNFFWRPEWRESPGYVRDPNAVSFILPHLAHLFRQHHQQMPPALADRLYHGIERAGEALLAHRGTWGYTNIALLNIASQLLIAEVTGDQRIRRLGGWDWEEWRNHTGRAGVICETFSATYSYVQLQALALIADSRATDEAMAVEARQVLRHVLSAMVLDYHPRVGRITGPQSRAYVPDRRLRGQSAVDTVLYLLWGEHTPGTLEALGKHLWLGAAVIADDVLPGVQHDKLPRHTMARTADYRRENYLAPEYALGSMTCDNRLLGVALPVMLAFPGKTPRCTIAAAGQGRPHAYWAHQKEGALLTAATWCVDAPANQSQEELIGTYSGLKTGRPDSLNITAPPAWDFELGLPDQIVLLDGEGQPLDTCQPQAIAGQVVALSVGSVHVGLRFFSSDAEGVALRTSVDATGELHLEAMLPHDGKGAGERGGMVMLGFGLMVEPISAGRLLDQVLNDVWQASAAVSERDDAWRITMAGKKSDVALQLDVRRQEPLMYADGDVAVTANQWCRSLLAADVTTSASHV